MYINRLSLSFLFFLLVLAGTIAQQRYDIPVRKGSGELEMPWTGGYNAPQFSNIDFNRDGIQDLISFDRQGDILRTFVRLPASGRWIQDWSYEAFFPALVDWVLITDYDNDGVEDLFTSASPTGVAGVSVYKGSYENEVWSFRLLSDRGEDYLQVPAGGGLTNAYVSWEDIPAIKDIDNDGDIDILSFEPDGSYISYYQNQSVEMGWGVDSFRLELTDFCWGKVLENELTEEVYLSDNPDMCSDGNFTDDDFITNRHTGSTVTTIDIDFDGDQDAWVGDVSSRYLVLLKNGLNAEEAWITEQEARFPSNDTTINLPYFVAAYSVELDDDPEPELLAAINSSALAEDRKSVWRYDDNIFTDGPLEYQLTQKGWLQNEMIDAGSISKPAFADINGDGLTDLVMGGYHFTETGETRIPSLWYYRNSGTHTQPSFVFVTDDFLSMRQYANETFDYSPAFGDLDGNGSVDLVVGEQNGKLFYFRNTQTAGDSMIFTPPVFPFMNIAVGVSSTPQIVDVNGDNLSDLVIGERTGNADVNGRCSNLNYFENIGTPDNPEFNGDVTVAPNSRCFGRVLFDLQIGLPQYSTPAIVSTENNWILVTGGDPGGLWIYEDLHEGITGSLSLVDDNYGDLDFGNRSAPALVDLTHDGFYELVVGNQRGGLEMFKTEISTGTVSVEDHDIVSIKPYLLQSYSPDGRFALSWKNDHAGTWELYDVQGRKLVQNSDPVHLSNMIDIHKYAPGIYFIYLQVKGQTFVEKLVKSE